MLKSEQIRLVKELMRHLDEDTNVDAGGTRRNPSSAYTCPELAARERERFFRGHPQLIGLSGDLAGPGTFVTRSDFGVPILAVRDAEGRFRAFLNVCRHRGAIVEPSPRGERSRFSCPFHGWTYSNRGDLVGLPKPDHFGPVDRACHGLIALPAQERHGLLFVHPDPDARLEADEVLGGVAQDFESWGFGDYVLTREETYGVRLNWKLAMDTFGETYHFNVLHRNSLAGFFYGNVQAYDVFGRNHRMILCKKSIDELRGRPEDTWHINVAGFPVYYLFPNVQVNVGTAGVVVVRAYPDPDDVGRSISRVSFYVNPRASAAEEMSITEFHESFGAVVRDEDYAVAATCQRGAESGLQDSVLFGRNEPALHHYHNTYREALGMEPLPLLSGDEARGDGNGAAPSRPAAGVHSPPDGR